MPTRTIADVLKDASSKITTSKIRDQKVSILRSLGKKDYILKTLDIALHPEIKFNLPEGTPPFKSENVWDNEGMLQYLIVNNKLRYFFSKSNTNIRPAKLEQMFIDMLQAVHPDDAKIIISMKDRNFEDFFPGITEDLYREAFPERTAHWPKLKTKSTNKETTLKEAPDLKEESTLKEAPDLKEEDQKPKQTRRKGTRKTSGTTTRKTSGTTTRKTSGTTANKRRTKKEND